MSRFHKMVHHESFPGLLLIAAAFLALLTANSSLSGLYEKLLQLKAFVGIGGFSIAKPLLLWINDGLMAVFFLLVGLELKREILVGGLSDIRSAIFPGIAAVGGMVVPALIYAFCNADNPDALHGWAIPAATDIAFALGVLSLLGSRIPFGLKIFLTSLAIFDDIGAIVIIALFFTSKISAAAIIIALVSVLVLWWMNRRNVHEVSPYLVVGVVLWTALLKSGVHATLAGTLVAAFIPLRSPDNREYDPASSPLRQLEHDLHGIVSYFILPLFAFANSGIPLHGISSQAITHPVPMGIALGLFLGKQLGIFGFCWISLRLGIGRLPQGSTLANLYGVSVLGGIGFTMSLFIGSLAFEATGVDQVFDERLGIILGSLASALLGYFILAKTLPREPDSSPRSVP